MNFTLNPYKIAVQWRNKRFDAGKNRIETADIPVISVGNISAGGTGKTPFVRTITAFCRENCIIPAVVSRGYGRRTSGVIIAGDGRHGTIAMPDEVGDELLLHAADGIAVAAEKRIDGCRKACELGATLCVLDDGFQHRQLRRDLDIVLLDAETLNGRMIPFGLLREPLASIRRAHIVALREDISPERTKKLPLNPNSLLIRYTTKIGTAYALGQTDGLAPNLTEKMLALCGIARPERFFAAIDNNFTLVGKIALSDHVRFNGRIVKKILDNLNKSGGKSIITTEKDAVKLLQFKSVLDEANIPVVILPIQTIVTDGKDDFHDIVLSVAKAKNKYD